MPERTQLNININPDLLKNLKKAALENNRKLVELINEVLSNYISDIKNDQINNRSILDELDEVKNRISVLENSKPDFCITHSPGKMLITDKLNNDLAAF